MLLYPNKDKFLINKEDCYLILCFCAEWCATCRQYKQKLSILSEQLKKHTFYWIDIEDNYELVGDEDITNFPTLLVQIDEKTVFYGSIDSNIDYLNMIIRTVTNNNKNIATKLPNIWKILEE
ncbi:thioredoxin-like protein [Candidatus Kinetoplastibacterium blastocrithidii TCC012E]|uniref:Thioredoxin-like protein n=1 Tax=Candidatus Kinetoplastidibacterium blastocrithidiae TCC012E TaxID=1208922 RepID=M1M103_9PROT|nr:thioredoxin family protein [Candidatus Kinetoplastibacterium blastocrithidii]AGF49961.1 thioredoxin-like protein [Candidatus Kinetoplastibacterium blastocrithidii TCC012E]